MVSGSSCISKILNANQYEGVVGVACGEEIKMGVGNLENSDVAGQAIPLIKNGCANTAFSMTTLVNTL